MKLDPLEGKVIRHLTIVARASDSQKGSARYFTRCSCGRERIFYAAMLKEGKRQVTSCGCQGTGMVPRRWTEEDLEYLRKWYPLKGWHIAKEMNRTRPAVRHQADLLGLVCTKRSYRFDLWTPEQDDLLRRHYPHGGAIACLRVFPTRSKGALRNRAHLLGIRCPSEKRGINRWKTEEHDIIRANYPSGGWEACHKLLPHRSRDAIMAQSKVLGLFLPPAWTDEEENLLRRFYPDGGLTESRKHLPRHSDTAIKGKVRNLGAQSKSVPMAGRGSRNSPASLSRPWNLRRDGSAAASLSRRHHGQGENGSD